MRTPISIHFTDLWRVFLLDTLQLQAAYSPAVAGVAPGPQLLGRLVEGRIVLLSRRFIHLPSGGGSWRLLP